MTVRTVATRLMLDISGYMGPLKAAAAGTKQFGSEFERSARAGSEGMDRLSQGALVAGAGILAGFGVAAKSAMDFDKQMSSVGAAAGKTGKDLNGLREAALKAGADTAFSATQAAKAEEELAKAGVSVRDILGGGLQGALDLATAGQLEVGNAAEIAATAMTQFGLSGSKVPHIADLLSASANKAQGSVGDMGMALKQGGLVASQFGLSIEETTGGLAAFAKAGLLGSDAGTSLKTMLLALANPSKESAALMERLGINAYDAQGNFVGLAGLAGQLRNSLAGLTQQQRDQALAQIFGADATRAANVLYRNGAEGIKKWTSEVDDAGNAARTAAAKTDNLAGDLERLQGALETALIKQGSGATGVLRVLAQTTGNMVDGFAKAPAPIQGTVTVLGLVVGSALAAAGAYGVMAPKIREASTALIGMGAAGRVANTALIGAAKGAGVALLAISALQIATTAFGSSAAVSAGELDHYTRSLGNWAETGRTSKDTAAALGENMQHLSDDVLLLGRRAGGGFDEFASKTIGLMESVSGAGRVFEGSVTQALERMNNLDQGLAQMAKSGNVEGARAAFNRIAAAAKEQGVSIDHLRAGLPLYAAAQADAKNATAQAGSAMGTTAGQARVMASGMASAVREAGTLKDVLAGLNDVNISAAEAGIKWRLSLSALTGELRSNKGWTDAARQALIDQIKTGHAALAAQHEQTTATRGQVVANAQASTSHAQMRAAMINTAVAAGKNRQAVIELIDSLFKIPSNRSTHVTAPGTLQATAEVKALRDRLAEIKNKQTHLSQRGAEAASLQIHKLELRIAALTSKNVDIGVRMKGFSADSASRWLAGKAKGGPVSARTPYLVGEEGPEVIVPAAAGTVIPNSRIVLNINPQGYAGTFSALGAYARGLAATVNRAEAAAARMDSVGNPSLGTGWSSTVGAIAAIGRRFYGGARVSSGYRPGDPGWHGRGLAADLVGGGATGMRQIAAGFYGMSNRLLELIHTPGGYFVKNGRRANVYGAETRSQHYDHVHVAARADALGMARGGVRAHTVNSPTVLYGERETGGEAFVPRRGDTQRSKAIMDVAASWYGYRLEKAATGGLYGAVNELYQHVRKGGWYTNDLTFRGASANLNRHNDQLTGMFRRWAGRGGADFRNRRQIISFLSTVRPPVTPKAPAPAAAEPAVMNNAALTSGMPMYYSQGAGFGGRAGLEGALTSARSAQASTVYITLSPTFTGPVGSRLELQNWLSKSVEELRRRGRV